MKEVKIFEFSAANFSKLESDINEKIRNGYKLISLLLLYRSEDPLKGNKYEAVFEKP